MESRLKYIKDNGYDVEDQYLESLDKMDYDLSIIIENYIDENVLDVPPNNFVSYIFGGVVRHYNKDHYFALEIVRTQGSFLLLSNIDLINVNEYLDLINLNCYIKCTTKKQ